MARCPRTPWCCRCFNHRAATATPPDDVRFPFEPIDGRSPVPGIFFCPSCRGYLRTLQLSESRTANPGLDTAFRTLLAHQTRLARLSQRASPSRSPQSRGLAANSTRIQRPCQNRNAQRRDSAANTSLNNQHPTIPPLAAPSIPVLTMPPRSGYPSLQFSGAGFPQETRRPDTPSEDYVHALNDSPMNSSGTSISITPNGYGLPPIDYSLSFANRYLPPSDNPHNILYNSFQPFMDDDLLFNAASPSSTNLHGPGSLSLNDGWIQHRHEEERDSLTEQPGPRNTPELNANPVPVPGSHPSGQDDPSQERRVTTPLNPSQYTNTQSLEHPLSSHVPMLGTTNVVESTHAPLNHPELLPQPGSARAQRSRRRNAESIDPNNSFFPTSESRHDYPAPQGINLLRVLQARRRAGITGGDVPFDDSHLRHVERTRRFIELEQARELARLHNGHASPPPKPKGLDNQDDGRPPPKEADELTVNLECKVCMSQLIDTALLPCGHAVLCRWCARQHMSNNKGGSRALATCPVCRATIRQKIRIYIS
ncbi:hypothetical protein VTO42DRAFT_5617 [Malbranchea cinnamomea]